MAIFRFAGNVQAGQEPQMCSYPVGLDSYRSGCSNNCCYCYVRHRLQDLGAWNITNPSVLDLQHLSATFGQILGETRDNLIPEEEIIRGDMEAINNKLREDIQDNIERLVKGLTSAYGPAAGTLHSTFPAGVEGL